MMGFLQQKARHYVVGTTDPQTLCPEAWPQLQALICLPTPDCGLNSAFCSRAVGQAEPVDCSIKKAAVFTASTTIKPNFPGQ
jgi:hypothetical protein